MKCNKIFLILQVIAMYLMQLPFYAILVVVRLPIDTDVANNWVAGLLIAALVMAVLFFPLCIVNAALSVLSVFKGNENLSKTVMICKLALIPWYIMNFAVGIILIAGLLNPFLMVAIPIVLMLLVGFTYLFMVATSCPNFAFFIRGAIRRAGVGKAPTIVAVAFMFFFGLDVIGSIMFFRNTKDLGVSNVIESHFE